MCAPADGPIATHFSTSPQCCFGDLSWAKKVDLDANSEYQPGRVSKVIKRLLLLQGIWSPLSSEPLWNGNAYISTRFWRKSPVTPQPYISTILRPLNKLLMCWLDHQGLVSRLLIWRSGRHLICQPGALGNTTRGSNNTSWSLLLQVMKTEVFFHGNSIINQLIKILKTTA